MIGLIGIAALVAAIVVVTAKAARLVRHAHGARRDKYAVPAEVRDRLAADVAWWEGRGRPRVDAIIAVMSRELRLRERRLDGLPDDAILPESDGYEIRYLTGELLVEMGKDPRLFLATLWADLFG